MAPAGDMSKLMTALHFGADAVYVGGSKFSLRANAKNFDGEGLKEAVEYTHARGKKLYVAVNVFANNSGEASGLTQKPPHIAHYRPVLVRRIGISLDKSKIKYVVAKSDTANFRERRRKIK